MDTDFRMTAAPCIHREQGYAQSLGNYIYNNSTFVVIRQMNRGFLTSDTGDLPTVMKSYQDVRDDAVLGTDKGATAQFSQHSTG